jgi:cysteinyl-tRNA synthetase
MPLRVYNTLTRTKEEFRTVHPGKVGMYLCGPTVYKPSHVGHMVGPVIFDTVKRYLTYLGYETTFVVNITDVDDKLIKQAALEKTSVSELAERITTDYLRSLERLGVVGINHFPRATQFIGDMITFIQGLIEKGYAYPAGGDVYFDVTRDHDYGKLCNRDPEQLEAGARIEVSEKKRNPGDFALWKAAKPGEPKWDSPWGAGRPGWHIECSAMSMRLLGKTLDIHGGGLDLTFPHHENELAQSESYTGETFSHYWMHNGLMRIRSQAGKIKDQVGVGGSGAAGAAGGELEVISKSRGNEIVVSELFNRHEPETLRLLLLSTHYRSPIEYSDERLQEMRRSLEGFYRFFERYQRVTKSRFYDVTAPRTRADFVGRGEFLEAVAALRARFLDLMDDDFNSGGAIGVLNELLTTLNRFADARRLESDAAPTDAVAEFRQATVVLRELSHLLGLFEVPVTVPKAADDGLVNGLMQLLIDLRAEARKAKNFALGDQIRKRLSEIGVTLEDRAGGTNWRKD